MNLNTSLLEEAPREVTVTICLPGFITPLSLPLRGETEHKALSIYHFLRIFAALKF